MAVDINQLLETIKEKQATDLHIKAGAPPMMRVKTELVALSDDKLKPEETEAIAKATMTEDRWERFRKDLEMDYSYALARDTRFRCNAYMHLGTVAMAFRLLRKDILDFEKLYLPEVVRRLAQEQRGLVLVTGITGSGKSTTLATMLDYINTNRSCHIITVEDPIEFLHDDKKSLVSQREIGSDTNNFFEALKRALRQDPDVILIGEMRDVETIRTAISAAETGHLVFSTLHTVQAQTTVERIISFFPGNEQGQVRMQLASNLKGVISQRLLRRADGSGLIPALEIMSQTLTISKLILDGRIRELRQAIQNRENGMMTFNQCLADLVKKNLVTQEEAMTSSDEPSALKRILTGGMAGGDSTSIIGGF